MQNTIATTIAVALICLVPVEWTIAQRQTGDTASHRRIPLTNGTDAPSLEALLSNPELQEMLVEYEKLRGERTAQRQAGLAIGNEQTSHIDQLLQRELELMQDQKGAMPPVREDELAEQIKSVSGQLGKRLGQELAETIRPGSVEYDPGNSSTWDRLQQLGRNIGEKRRQARREFNEVQELLQKSWPDDSVAPNEWFNKVQPFINPEVIEQLSEAARQFESQEHLPPDERRFQSIDRIPSLTSSKTDTSKSMFDSIMTSIDKQGTNWIKSSEKEKSSLWKSFQQSAQKGLKSINQKMTRNSTRQAGATQDRTPGMATTPARRTTGSRLDRVQTDTTAVSPTDSTITDNAWVWLLGLAALAIAIAGYFFIVRGNSSNGHSNALTDRSLADQIHDRESLLVACHSLARNVFGIRSCFWNHRTLFDSLSERVESRQPAVTQLSAIYEQARYAPKAVLETEFARARELFLSLQRGLQTEA